jgi:hypothetical protein|tara:strand:+ start:455 stop:778 length:324 start_codon:yes stop_codon:yes gene_type:complete
MFKKEGFDYFGGYLTYEGKFVARFKYVTYQGAFKNCLIKNFTPEEYFTRYENGESPLAILESKGFMTPMAKKACKKIGLPATLANYKIAIKSKLDDAMAFRSKMVIQ